MEVTLRDLDEDYASLPEPPAGSAPNQFPDTYLGGLERYIFALGDYIRKIQDEEAEVMNQFTKRLQKLKGKASGKRADAEDEARADYAAQIERIRHQRRLFRKMKLEAIQERQKLLDSMAIQKDDEELLKRKLFKIRATPDEESLAGNGSVLDPFAILLIIFQLGLCLIFGFVTRFPRFDYPVASSTQASSLSIANLVQGGRGYELRLDDWYTFYTHIALMVFFGFGFLGAFMKKYGYSSIGYTLIVAVLAFQFTILNDGLWFNINRDAKKNISFSRITLTMDVIIGGLYGATACIVSLGVFLGKLKPVEIVIVAFIEVIWYSINRYVNLLVLNAQDPGGAVSIHLFGAIFGLAASGLISRHYNESLRRDHGNRQPEEYASSTQSDLLALIGSVTLFVFFPSFNGAFAPNGTQYRVVINSILSLLASAIVTFAVSRAFRNRLFNIRDIQNSILSGGIAMGSCHAFLIQPGAALLVGAVAGAVSVVGFVWITPFLESKLPLKIYDTRGVNNVHGLPGLIGGIAGIVAASIADKNTYNQDTKELLPRGHPSQGGIQAAMFGITIGIALLSGLATGLLIFYARRATGSMSTIWFSDETEFIVAPDFERKTEAVIQAPVAAEGGAVNA